LSRAVTQEVSVSYYKSSQPAGWCRSLFLVLTLGITFQPVGADSVTMANGSTLTGILKRITKGTVHLDTGFAGVLKIDQKQLMHLHTDEPTYFRLSSGSTLLGQSGIGAKQGDLSVRTQNGPVAFSVSDIRDAWRKLEEDPAVTAMKNEEEKKRRKWTYSAGVDLSGQKGNSNEFGLTGQVGARLKGPLDLLKIYFSVHNSERDGIRISDETKGGVDYSSDLVDRFGWYSRFELEKDKFEELALRSTSALGISYKLIKSGSQVSRVRAGFAYRYESFDTKENIEDPAIDFGLDYAITFRELFKFDSKVTYVPDYSDFTNFRFGQDTGLEIPFRKDGFWKIRMGLSHFYNSNPVRGKENLDTKYYTRLVFTWGEK
jgi:putative salt-induced outer membrane protein YdiY